MQAKDKNTLSPILVFYQLDFFASISKKRGKRKRKGNFAIEQKRERKEERKEKAQKPVKTNSSK